MAKTILDLPIELLQETAYQAPWTQQLFRAACKQLHSAIDPIFFASHSVVLDARSCESRLYGGISYLEALARGTTGWSRYARRLEINNLERGFPDEQLEQVRRFLRPALASLRPSIQAVIWSDGSGDPHGVRDAVVEFIESLPTLDEFQLAHGVDPPNLSLSHLSGVRTLKLSAPVSALRTQPILQVIAHSRALSCLHLQSLSSGSTWTDIWALLRAEKIELAELSVTGGGTDALLAYLGSYAGLKHLCLSDSEDTTGSADTFAHVLPRHAATLETLRCPAGSDGRWSFGVHNANALLGLNDLVTLEMSANSVDVGRLSTETHKNVVELFIDVAAQLPVLRHLSMVATGHPGGRGPAGNGLHRAMVGMQIREILESYGPSVESSAVAQWVEARPLLSILMARVSKRRAERRALAP
ncbi:hypothetical protein DFH09DRAFT_1356649 [Mycena vulgaris]|nr:hypothetical protein DFH09DRAFT_1356649 [Mycena vulgaris]